MDDRNTYLIGLAPKVERILSSENVNHHQAKQFLTSFLTQSQDRTHRPTVIVTQQNDDEEDGDEYDSDSDSEGDTTKRKKKIHPSVYLDNETDFMTAAEEENDDSIIASAYHEEIIVRLTKVLHSLPQSLTPNLIPSPQRGDFVPNTNSQSILQSPVPLHSKEKKKTKSSDSKREKKKKREKQQFHKEKHPTKSSKDALIQMEDYEEDIDETTANHQQVSQEEKTAHIQESKVKQEQSYLDEYEDDASTQNKIHRHKHDDRKRHPNSEEKEKKRKRHKDTTVKEEDKTKKHNHKAVKKEEH